LALIKQIPEHFAKVIRGDKIRGSNSNGDQRKWRQMPSRDQKGNFRGNFLPQKISPGSSRAEYGPESRAILGGERLQKALIRFLPDDVTVEAFVGELLLDAALAAGIFIPAACGGSGACGQCKVKVVDGSVEALKVDKVHAAARAAGYENKYQKGR